MDIPEINSIKNALRNHVPGPVGTWQYYSVLLPLVEKDGALHIIYELRSPELLVQPNEVSFPGGRIEDGESPGEAARRETAEELGIPADAIEIISEFDYLLSYGGLKLHCFPGVIPADALEKAQVNTNEVKEFFLVPLVWLLENKPEIYINRILPEPAKDIPIKKLAPDGDYNWRTGTSVVPIYTWPDPETGGERIIWGMTAQLTMRFVDFVKRIKNIA